MSRMDTEKRERMGKTLDMNGMKPLLKSAIIIFESVSQLRLTAGEPAIADFPLEVPAYTVTIGFAGHMNGQVMFAMDTEHAKEIAGRMICDIPVVELDEIARSALEELANMIMGNMTIIYSTFGKRMDITTPVSSIGNPPIPDADVNTIYVPLLLDGTKYVELYICMYE